MTDDIKIVQSTVKRSPVRARGPLSSQDYNNFQDQVFSDIVTMSNAINSLYNQQQKILRVLESDNIQLKRRIEAVEQTLDYTEFAKGKLASKIDRYIDFHDTSNIMYLSSVPESRRVEIKAQFGELYVPSNGIENKFFSFSLRNNRIVLPVDLTTSVTSKFDKLDGQGTQDYEYGGSVVPGSPENAFNGINESFWTRAVAFPLESNVKEVEVQLTAIVPSGVSSEANLIEIVPYPDGAVDIIQVATSSDLSSAFVAVDNFSIQNNAIATRYHFSTRSVEQVRIRIRCRNWREIDGKKVFIYGLQEFALKLVDYNKLDTVDQSFGDSLTAVVKVPAPSGVVFDKLYRIDPKPNFYLEDSGARHVRLRITSTPDFSDIKWDSAVHILPQQSISNPISLGSLSTIYAIYTLKYVKSSGGYQSPFPIGTTPIVKGLGLLFSTIQSDTL